MKAAIYWIVGPNGKAYIGSSQNVAARLRTHRSELQRGVHANVHLQRAVNKYGIDKFLFQVIEHCEINRLIEREQFHIDTQNFDTLYNARVLAASSRGHKWPEESRARIRGHFVSQDTRAKMSAARRAQAPISDETRAKMSEAARSRSAETRAKMSEAARKRKLSAETRAKIAEANRNRPPISDETRARLVEVARARAASPKWREKMAAVNRNRPPISDETRAKMAEASRARTVSNSGYRGVSKLRNKWHAYVGSRKTRKGLGSYTTRELAYTWRLAYIAQMEWGV